MQALFLFYFKFSFDQKKRMGERWEEKKIWIESRRGRITSFDLLVALLLVQWLAFWAAIARCLFMLNLSSTDIPRSFSTGLLSSH